MKPLTRTCETPTRKKWGSDLTGTGWPGIPQGYPCYSLQVYERELAEIVAEMDPRDTIVVQGGYERKLAKIIVEMDLRDTIVVQGDYEREFDIIVVEMALYCYHHRPPFSPS